MKALYFDEASQGREIKVAEIPEDHRERATNGGDKLLEAVALLDDARHGDIPRRQTTSRSSKFTACCGSARLQGMLQPTFCGASLNYIGVQPLLDAVVRYLPSPLDRPPVEGSIPIPKKRDKVREIRKCSPEGAVLRAGVQDRGRPARRSCISSASIRACSRAAAGRSTRGPDKKELISQLWRIQADSREKIETDAVEAGDIVGVVGPKDSVTGDTLCDAHHPILLERIAFPETGHLDGDRARHERRAQEARRRAGPAVAAGPDVHAQASAKRPGRRSSAAWANCTSKSSASAFSATSGSRSASISRASATASRSEGTGRGRRGVPSPDGGRNALRQGAHSARAVCRRRSRSPSSTRSSRTSCPRDSDARRADAARRSAGGRPAGPSVDERAAHDPRRRLPPRGEPPKRRFARPRPPAVREVLNDAGVVLLEPIMKLEVDDARRSSWGTSRPT